MSGGFWAGAVPPWAYCAFACVCVLFLCVGELDGWRRGEREAREDESYALAGIADRDEAWEREQAKARRVHSVYRQSARSGVADLSGIHHHPHPPPEIAHDWPAHVEQALAVTAPDLRSDEEWMADEFAKLHAFMDTVLNAHPVTEDMP